MLPSESPGDGESRHIHIRTVPDDDESESQNPVSTANPGDAMQEVEGKSDMEVPPNRVDMHKKEVTIKIPS